MKSSNSSGDRIAADVTALSSDGRGIVKLNELVFFAEHTVPGDRIAFQPNPASKPPSAEQVRVLKRSPHRCEHPCPLSDKCPASIWGIVDDATQLSEKTGLVRRVLRGVVEADKVQEMIPSPELWGYRNRLSLKIAHRARGGFEIGYSSGARSNEVIPIRDCLIAEESMRHALRQLSRKLKNERSLDPSFLPSRLQLHVTAEGPGAVAIYSHRIPELAARELCSYLEDIDFFGGVSVAVGNAAGLVGERGIIWRDEACSDMSASWFERSLDVHPCAFTQANPRAASLILNRLREVSHTYSFRTVWDLYGGYGALGFSLASSNSRVVVVESNPFSRGTFEQLSKIAPCTSSEFICGEAVATFKKLSREVKPEDVIVLDPPRSGAHPELIELLVRARARNIIYLSCNPARLARDLRPLVAAGWQTIEVQPVDFFPQTPEIEALAILHKPS
ncbi:class I SAM-dependent RNA methyltransferase [bacterium]|nr:class I SAM-dependent RNA methyltransferase [bacterium]